MFARFYSFIWYKILLLDRTRSPPNFPLSGTTTKTTAAASSDKIVYAEPRRLGNNRLDSFDEVKRLGFLLGFKRRFIGYIT